MTITIVLIIIIGACLGAIIWLGVRKLPQVRVVNPGSSKEAKAKELKYSLLTQRIERIGAERSEAFKKSIFAPVAKGMQSAVRKVAGKLKSMEQQYADRQKSGGEQQHNPEVLRVLLREAEDLIDEGRYDAAEKKLIEIVSHDPKNAAAYERLGRVYFLNKDYEGARETLLFLNKLTPRDASVLAALGEVMDAKGDKDEALRCYLEALDISPNNPKYLDFAIETTIEHGDVMKSNQLLDRLREVNPENAKIADFEEMIDIARKKKLA